MQVTQVAMLFWQSRWNQNFSILVLILDLNEAAVSILYFITLLYKMHVMCNSELLICAEGKAQGSDTSLRQKGFSDSFIGVCQNRCLRYDAMIAGVRILIATRATYSKSFEAMM
jgi:hypothetical protein